MEGLYYLRPREAFYRTPFLLVPPQEAPPDERIPLAKGLHALRPFVRWYEAQVEHLAPGHRARTLKGLTATAQRALEA